MGQRLELQALLEELLDRPEGETPNVYFQPPANVQLAYPCIVYQRDALDAKFADNALYNHKQRYQVTVIDRNPDSEIPLKLAALPMCSFNRFFVANNLNHDVYNLYF